MPRPSQRNKFYSGEGLTIAKILRFILIPFRPTLLQTYIALDRFIDVPIEKLKADGKTDEGNAEEGWKDQQESLEKIIQSFHGR